MTLTNLRSALTLYHTSDQTNWLMLTFGWRQCADSWFESRTCWLSQLGHLCMSFHRGGLLLVLTSACTIYRIGGLSETDGNLRSCSGSSEVMASPGLCWERGEQETDIFRGIVVIDYLLLPSALINLLVVLFWYSSSSKGIYLLVLELGCLLMLN